MSQVVINPGVGAATALSWCALASVATTPATRTFTPAAHAYRAYAATAAYAHPAKGNKHFMGSGSWSSLR